MSNTETTNKPLALVTPHEIHKATKVSHEDAFAMIANVLKSDFSAKFIQEWLNMDMEELSYAGYIDTQVENLAECLVGDRGEMMCVEAHLEFVEYLRELGNLKRQGVIS